MSDQIDLAVIYENRAEITNQLNNIQAQITGTEIEYEIKAKQSESLIGGDTTIAPEVLQQRKDAYNTLQWLQDFERNLKLELADLDLAISLARNE
jgi:hypothetical protein